MKGRRFDPYAIDADRRAHEIGVEKKILSHLCGSQPAGTVGAVIRGWKAGQSRKKQTASLARFSFDKSEER